MITTVTGTNAYLVRQELARLTGDFVGRYGDLGLERFECDSLDPASLPAILQSLPFLAEKRLVVLHNPTAQKAVVEQVEKLLADIPETTDLIIVEPTLDKRTSFYKALKKDTEFKSFDSLDERNLVKWLEASAKEQGGSISSADANYLVRQIGTNQSMLANELSKLVAYDPQITKQSIDLLTEPLPLSSVFDLLDAALAGNRKKIVALYKEQRQQKVEPHAILGMLAWQLHVLSLLKTSAGRDPQQIVSEGKVSPFVVRKSQGVAAALSFEDLKRWVHDARQLDMRLKSEPIDADDAMLYYLLTLK